MIMDTQFSPYYSLFPGDSEFDSELDEQCPHDECDEDGVCYDCGRVADLRRALARGF